MVKLKLTHIVNHNASAAVFNMWIEIGRYNFRYQIFLSSVKVLFDHLIRDLVHWEVTEVITVPVWVWPHSIFLIDILPDFDITSDGVVGIRYDESFGNRRFQIHTWVGHVYVFEIIIIYNQWSRFCLNSRAEVDKSFLDTLPGRHLIWRIHHVHMCTHPVKFRNETITLHTSMENCSNNIVD